MTALAVTLRRLIGVLSWPLGMALLLCAHATMLMYMPMRIDHHGWQLAMLAVTVAGLCDPHARRGGALVGLASAVSLAIGLEMLPYSAMAGAILTLRWVWDRAEAERLAVYALTLGGERGGVRRLCLQCQLRDALRRADPGLVIGDGGGGRVAVPARPDQSGVARCAAGSGGGRGRGDRGRFRQPVPAMPDTPRTGQPRVATQLAEQCPRGQADLQAPASRRAAHGDHAGDRDDRGDRRGLAATDDRLDRGGAVHHLRLPDAVVAGACRPAGQMLAVPGIAALLWMVLPWLAGLRSPLLRVSAIALAVLVPTGIAAGWVVNALPGTQPTAYANRVNRATGQCVRTSVLTRVNAYPKATVFTFVDLGPRLIVTTHHDAIAGPYHRNGDAILDVQHAFQGNEAQARAIMKRHGATLLLICPDMAESTNYRARAPAGSTTGWRVAGRRAG